MNKLAKVLWSVAIILWLFIGIVVLLPDAGSYNYEGIDYINSKSDDQINELIINELNLKYKGDQTLINYNYPAEIRAYEQVKDIIRTYDIDSKEYEVLDEKLLMWNVYFSMVIYEYEEDLDRRK